MQQSITAPSGTHNAIVTYSLKSSKNLSTALIKVATLYRVIEQINLIPHTPSVLLACDPCLLKNNSSVSTILKNSISYNHKIKKRISLVFVIKSFSSASQSFGLNLLNHYLNKFFTLNSEFISRDFNLTKEKTLQPLYSLIKSKKSLLSLINDSNKVSGSSYLVLNTQEINLSKDLKITEKNVFHSQLIRNNGSDQILSIILGKSFESLANHLKNKKQTFFVPSSESILSPKTDKIQLPKNLMLELKKFKKPLLVNSLDKYAGKTTKYGILKGALGDQILSDDVKPLIDAFHKILAGGKLKHNSVQISGQVNQKVYSSLNKLMDQGIKEMNITNKINGDLISFG